MKKTGEIFIIIAVISVFIIAAVLFGLTGMKNGGLNYVKLEVNPKIEFVTNSKDKVVSAFPINEEAKEIITNEQFVGLKIEDAVKLYLELCTSTNYFDVDRDDNAIKLTVVSGLTQALEVKLYRTINNYFVNHEIMAIIVENQNDLQSLKDSKKEGISVGKFALVQSVLNLYPDKSMEEVKKLSEKELIKEIKTAHTNLEYAIEQSNQTELNDKAKLIDFNRAKVNKHLSEINDKSISKFKEEFVKHSKKHAKDYEANYEKMYEQWVQNRINNSYA